MLPPPRADLKPNTADFERLPLVKPTGFPEYDSRWLFPQEINLLGLTAVGLGMATLFAERGVKKRLVTGHDYRSYSASVKQALINGLLAGGCEVHDIGLALSPTAYFAQFDLDVEGVAMVTASHNDNGWTGIKMGLARPLTFGPDEMTRLKEIVLSGAYKTADGGRYIFVPDMAERYMKALADRPKLKRRLKVVAACGNGTAGAFAPQVLEAVGCEVVPLDTKLDYTFPRYNPNTEDMKMLHAIAEAVVKHKADVGLGALQADGSVLWPPNPHVVAFGPGSHRINVLLDEPLRYTWVTVDGTNAVLGSGAHARIPGGPFTVDPRVQRLAPSAGLCRDLIGRTSS